MFSIFAAFNPIEQDLIIEHKMSIEQENIIQLALEALRNKCAMHKEDTCIKEDDKGIVVNILGTEFLCHIKPSITVAGTKELVAKDASNIVLVTKYATPNLLKTLITEGVNVMDACGNFFIRHCEDNKVVFLLANKGEKNYFAKEKVQPLFQEAGLKLVFFLLQNNKNIGLPYRAMQKATGISLGSVKNILDTLAASNYILTKDGKRVLMNMDGLADAWLTEYARTLKPKLLLGRMSFRSETDRGAWQDINLPEGMCWGGECGANIVDGYLSPGSFEIYSDVAITKLMQSGKVRIDAGGEIAVYRKFWIEEDNNKTAPIFLLYADLLSQGSSRCIEAAEKLKEGYGFGNK